MGVGGAQLQSSWKFPLSALCPTLIALVKQKLQSKNNAAKLAVSL